MPVTYNTLYQRLELSGIVTNQEFYNAVSTDGLSETPENTFKLERDITLKSSCDLSQFGNVIIDLNTRFLHSESGVVDIIWRNVTFIESGQRLRSNRKLFKTIDGGSYQAEGGGIIWNAKGQPNNGANWSDYYALVISAENLKNVSLSSTEFPLKDLNGLLFTESSTIENLTCYRLSRIGNGKEGIRTIFKNLISSSIESIKGTNLTPYNYTSLMFINFENTALDPNAPSSTWLDDYSDNGVTPKDHYVYLLGTAIDIFSETGLGNLKNNLHVIGGGYKYYRFINGLGGKFGYFNSKSNLPQPSQATLTRDDMLQPETVREISSNEKIECVTQSFEYAHNGSSFVKLII